MRAQIIPTERRLPPWCDPTPEWRILGEPVSELTRSALAASGIGVAADQGTSEPMLVLPDDLLLSAEFVRDFLAIASTRSDVGPLVACLGPGAAAARSAGRSALPAGPDGSLPLPMLLWQGTQDAPPTTLADLLRAVIDAEPVVVDPQEKTREIEVPRAYADEGKSTITAAASTRIALHLRHRTHLLQANLDWLGGEFLRNVGSTPKIILALRFVWERFVRPGPRRLFSRIGKGCKIHPTAIIEASMLGDEVEVGAHAIVRASILGPGAVVEDGAHVQMCVVEDNARVGRQTSVFASLLMRRAHSTQGMMQMSVLGRDSATTRASWFIDTRFDGGNIRVEAPPDDLERFVDSGTRFLGCDVGHETIVGAAVLIAAGRMLPSNAKVVCDPATIMGRMEESIDVQDAEGAVLVVRDGKLEKL